MSGDPDCFICFTHTEKSFRLNTPYRVFIGILPALECHCQYRNETDQQEGGHKYPGTDRRLVGEAFQPIVPYPPTKGNCQYEADHQHNEITLGKHIENLTSGTSHDFRIPISFRRYSLSNKVSPNTPIMLSTIAIKENNRI